MIGKIHFKNTQHSGISSISTRYTSLGDKIILSGRHRPISLVSMTLGYDDDDSC